MGTDLSVYSVYIVSQAVQSTLLMRPVKYAMEIGRLFTKEYSRFPPLVDDETENAGRVARTYNQGFQNYEGPAVS